MTLFQHAGNDGLAADEGSDQIHIDDLVEFLNRHFVHGDALDDTGVVDQNVDDADLLTDPGNQSLHGGFIGHVGNIAVDIHTLSLICGNPLFPAGFIGAIEADGGTCSGKADTDGKADGMGTAGDQGYFPFQRELT